MTRERRYGYGFNGQSPAPTSLDPLDTSAPPPRGPSSFVLAPEINSDRLFIHSGWAHRRKLIRTALQACNLPWRRIWAFDHCGGNAWIQRSDEDPPRYRIQANWCRDRWCAVCAHRRGNQMAARILNDRDPRALRFLTLTLRVVPRGQAAPGEPGSLKYALDRLYAAFRRLRALSLWRNGVTGGAAFTEIKWSNASQGWHVHVHALIEGRYLPHPKLKEAWHRITGDSHVVDIRRVRTTTNAVNYVTRYVTKAWDRSTEQVPNRLHEAILALGSRRLVATFGSWRGTALRAVPSEIEWSSIMTLGDLRERMEAGSPQAYEIWHALHLGDGILPPGTAGLDTYEPP